MPAVDALYRHPVKGFTPEALAEVVLTQGGWFPGDRLCAVEHGASRFDPEAPEHLPKQKFSVLMTQAVQARVRTRWDEASNTLVADFDGEALTVALDDPASRRAFADRLAAFLGDEIWAPLKLIDAGPAHRFMDSHRGRVSVLNLASVRDLADRTGLAIDPLRFRANIWVEGWPAWIENAMAGAGIAIGSAVLTGAKPIIRCAAIDVDPQTGRRDQELVRALFETYGHIFCGLYCSIETGGRIAVGDAFTRRP